MKKRKVLFLLPVAALILSGCTFQEGWETVKGWTGSNIYEPVKNWVMKLLGQEEQKKEDKKDEEKGGGEQGGGEQGGGGQQETTKYGTLENPLTIAEAKEIIEEECLGDGDLTKQAIYCYGEIKTVYSTHDYDTGPAFELDVKDDEAEVYVYRVHGKEEDKANCKVGSIIHFHGFAKNYSGTLEFCDNGKNQCTVDSLAKPQGTEAVTGIEFDNPAYEVQVGKTINVTASVLPLNAGNQNYTLSLKDLSPAGCVELLEGNKLKGVAVGSAKVVATSEEGNFTAEATVTISAAINYGSLENPLTITEAMAVIDKESPTKEKVYVTGTVKSNKAYSTTYNNTEIWITDGTNDFELYGCNLPENFTPAQPVENDPALVGKEVIAHGTAKKYNSTYELDKGCSIDSLSNPTHVEVEEVVLTDTALALEVGQQADLSASVLPAKADQSVNWSVTSDPATVEVAKYENGKVSALTAGTAIVTATSVADSTKSASCTVTVTAASKTYIETIVATPSAVNMKVGDDPVELALDVTPANHEEEISWSITSGSDVISLDNDHKINALKGGSAVVRIEGSESHNGVDVNVTVTYAEPAKLNKTIAEIIQCDPTKGQAYSSYGQIKSWATNKGAASDTKTKYGNLIITDGTNDIFVYGASGVATDLAWQEATGEYKMSNSQAFLTNEITKDLQPGDWVNFWGTYYDYNGTKEMDMIITGPYIASPTSVGITSASELTVGGQLQLTATVEPSNASQEVVWSIESGETYASLENGVLTGLAAGDVVIRATAAGHADVYDEMTITVSAPTKKLVTSIVSDPASVSMHVGDNPVELSLTVTPADYEEELAWSVKEGEDVVELDANNHINALKGGSAVVRIEGEESHNGVEVNVTVTYAEPQMIDATLAEILAAPRAKNQLYSSQAQIKSWATNKGAASDTKTKYGNLILTDGTNDVFVYGASGVATDLAWQEATGEYKMSNSQAFLTNEITKDLQPGDTVKFYGQIYDYNGTTEMDVIITEKVDVFVEPTSVEITSANEVVVDSKLTLQATVGPLGASQEVVWSVTDGTGHATLANDNELTGVTEGTVTVTATAKGYSNVSDSMTVTVKAKSVTPTSALAAYVMNGGQASTSAMTAANVKANFFKDANCTGTNIVSSVDKAEKIYPDEGPSMKFASSSAKGELTLTLSQSVSKIVINVKAYNNDQECLAIMVNGQEITITKAYDEYEIEFTATTSISIASKQATKNRFYITNMDFYA